jgi:hypothetical protein
MIPIEVTAVDTRALTATFAVGQVEWTPIIRLSNHNYRSSKLTTSGHVDSNYETLFDFSSLFRSTEKEKGAWLESGCRSILDPPTSTCLGTLKQRRHRSSLWQYSIRIIIYLNGSQDTVFLLTCSGAMPSGVLKNTKLLRKFHAFLERELRLP